MATSRRIQTLSIAIIEVVSAGVNTVHIPQLTPTIFSPSTPLNFQRETEQTANQPARNICPSRPTLPCAERPR
ncbi:MAG: hypothetical protein RID53_30930 [Coleofasciculus sp. B1-GNL1-01]|uniref:hypothetical protein n=1 Tax=Coleofasciculus sp. B1-GNL1-01 TaxID=3068484 RepID=UPI0032FD486F